MTAIKAFTNGRRLCAAFLVGTALTALAVPAAAQEQEPSTAQAVPIDISPEADRAPTPTPATAGGTVQSVTVSGAQRLEPETVLSYMDLRPGQPYTAERLDQALKALYDTELFSDVQIQGADTGALVVQVRENPVVNRIILEGNRRLKDDKISAEIRLAPRQIFTRTKVRADVARIVELYRRQGRFAATVVPKIVQLDQNRVDLVFEVSEGPRSKVRAINIVGNERFDDGRLRSEMATKQSGLFSFLGSGATYDPDKLAFDQQKLRQFYLTEGYADFRVISAVAELTPDKQDFIITYVVEEGERYKFGEVKVESDIRDFTGEGLTALVPMKQGDWYDAKQVEDTLTALTESAGLFGYAFAQVEPDFSRDPETKTMGVTFKVADAPRVYVERIDINGNTVTRDKVVRREFRLAEGDPFNTVRVKRSRDRIQSLGYFQDNLEIEQTQGSAPDRVILSVDVEEKSTGELQLSAGFSSLERFLINASITQRNFMGKGQTLRASANYSTYSKSLVLGFVEPYLFDRNIALGGDIYRKDYNSFNFTSSGDRNTTYEQVTTGGEIRLGVPITEYLNAALRYSLNYDEVTLDEDLFFFDPDGNGPLGQSCDPLLAGRYLCDAIGDRVTSSIGYSLVYSTLNNGLRPTAGHRVILSQDFAGLGGTTKYIKTKLSGAKYWAIGSSGFVFSTTAEGGYIHSLEGKRFNDAGDEIEKIRLTDRYFLGEPQLRGFDIRGVGPRIIRTPFNPDGTLVEDRNQITDDALGGRAYYLARAELEIPLGAKGSELGLRPSVFLDVGALFGLKDPLVQSYAPGDPRLVRPILSATGNRQCVNGPIITEIPNNLGEACPTGTGTLLGTQIPPFQEQYLGDTAKPRISVGFGVNWNSPFGPFRIDIAKALTKAEGEDDKLLTFNVGTAF